MRALWFCSLILTGAERPPSDESAPPRPETTSRLTPAVRLTPTPSPLGSALHDLVDRAEGTGWQAVYHRRGPHELLSAASLLDESGRPAAVLKSLIEAHTVQWSAAGHDAHIALHVHRFADKAGARRYWAFALDLLRKQDEAWSGPNQPTQISESRYGKASSALAAAQVVRVDRRQRVAGTERNATIFVIQEDCFCLEIHWYGLEPDEAWAAKTLRGVLAVTATSAAE